MALNGKIVAARRCADGLVNAPTASIDPDTWGLGKGHVSVTNVCYSIGKYYVEIFHCISMLLEQIVIEL